MQEQTPEPKVDSADLTPEADLDKLSTQLAEQMEGRYIQRIEMKDRIRDGLSQSGKKLRRNALCPCGSGRKFKKCCLQPMKAKLDAKITNDGVTPTVEKEITDED